MATLNFALSIESKAKPDNLTKRIRKAFKSAGIDASVYYSRPTSAEERVQDAMCSLRAEYRSTVRGLVTDFQQAVKDGEIKDRDDAERWIHKTIDGHHDVIYTHSAQIVALVSDNDGAIDDLGSENMVKDGSIDWSAIAYCAMERDFQEALAAEDIDLDKIGEESDES